MTATLNQDVVTYRYSGQEFTHAIGTLVSLALLDQLAQIRTNEGRCDDNLPLRDIGARGHRGDLPHHYNGMHCSLPRHGEDQEHIFLDGARVGAAWNDNPVVIDEADTEKDPEPEPFDLVEGVIYKFRNKPTMLVYVRTRPDGQVEVLDLTHERWRVLDKSKLVPRPDDAEPPTSEQLMWLAKFMAERREEVRVNALTQQTRGYFKSDEEMNKVLAELMLRPIQEVLTGTTSLSFTYAVPLGMSKEEAKKLFQEWRDSLALPSGLVLSDSGVSHSFATRKE